MNSREFQDLLTRRATRTGVTVPPSLAAKLEAYYRLLATWNQKINLTGMDLAEPTPESVDRLLIEPLVAASHTPPGAARMVDIGSGGGSPAIPFALSVPGMRLRMVESRARKSVFLREAARVLEMEVDVLTSRFESLCTRSELLGAHDLLTIRAVRIDPLLLMSLRALVKPGGQLFLFSSSTGAPNVCSTLPLTRVGAFPLVDSLASQLVVLSTPVPRGT